LYDGYFFEDHTTIRSDANMPASTATFKEYSIILDLSSFSTEIKETEELKEFHSMLSIEQLKKTIPNLNIEFREFVEGRASGFYLNADANKLYLYPTDNSIERLKPEVLDNFDDRSQLRLINSSIAKNKTALDIIENRKSTFKLVRKKLNVFETEYYNRIAFSLSCIILFFIGAPLGSIIRKGGFGLPMILAISIYVLYFFANTFGRNLADDSAVTAFFGSWVSAILMIPFGILLTRRATKDMGIFNIDVFLQPITAFVKKITSKKTQNNGEQ
jgi:lipopolysaccharide export system permease protein